MRYNQKFITCQLDPGVTKPLGKHRQRFVNCVNCNTHPIPDYPSELRFTGSETADRK